MLDKLKYYGIKDTEHLWLGRSLFNRMQYVCYNQVNSEKEKICCGVPQQSVLSPLLFAIMINDIHLMLTNIVSN